MKEKVGHFIFFFIIIITVSSCFDKQFDNQNVIWKKQITGEIYQVQFLPEQNTILIGTDRRYISCDLRTGKQRWENKDIYTLFPPLIMNNCLVTGLATQDGIQFTDISTGKKIREINIEGWVSLVTTDNKNNLFFIGQHRLQRVNLQTNKRDRILNLPGG